MGRVIKQSAGNAFSNYLGVAIGALNLVILFPRAFADQPEYFGLIQLIISYALLVSTFTSLGVPNMIIRYFPETDKESRPKLLGFAFIYPLPVLALLFTGVWIFRNSIIPFLNDEQLFMENWLYILPLSMLNVYFEVFSSVATSHFKTQIPLFLKEVERRAVLSVLLLVYWAGWINLDIFLILYLLSTLVQFGLLVGYLIQKNYLQLNLSIGSVSKRPMIIYGGFLLLTSGFNFLVNQIDRLMIGGYLDLESVAHYSIAFFMGGVLNVPGKSILNVTRPLISTAFAKERLDEVERIYKATAVNMMIIGILLFTLLITNLRDLYFLLPEGYREGESVVILIALAQLLNASSGQNGIIISLSKYYKFNLTALVLLLFLSVGNNMIFIPAFGIEGAALATLISMGIFNTLKTIFVHRRLKMFPYEKRAWKIFPLFVMIFAAGYFFSISSNPLVDIALRSVLVVVIFIPMTFFLHISEDMDRIIKKMWKYVA